MSIALLFLPLAATAQVTSDFTLTGSPILDIPLGPTLSDGTSFYTVGGGISLKAEYSPPFAQFLYTGLALDADLLPINASGRTLTLVSLGPELGVQFFPFQRFGIRLAGFGGMYAGMLQEGTVLNPYVGALLDLSYLFSPSLSVGLGASYRHHFTPTTAIYDGLGVTLGVRWHIGAGTGSNVIQVQPDIAPIFPLFYSYYDKNEAGALSIRNIGTAPVQNVKVSFYVKQFMDQPKVAWEGRELARGQQVSAKVFALFTDRIFQVTEETKVAGEIQVSYSYLGKDTSASYPVSITVRNRNAMTWSDTNRAAAFVTTNDPWVRSFTARAVPDARSKGRAAVNSSFRAAMALFDAMNLYGISYLPDPVTWASKATRGEAVDYLQFPAQSLEVKAGDCDDLSILYTALLESAGIETAFITDPGHIYMAFNLGMDPKQAAAVFGSSADLIVKEGQTWMPVEITMVKDGFVKAWQFGAQEWRASSAAGNADFYPLHTAWETYTPANTGDIIKSSPVMPDSPKIYDVYTRELTAFYNLSFAPRIKAIQDQLKTKKDDPKLLNSLGVLYARFGMYPEARAQFAAIVARSGDVPSALINLGNLEYLAGNNQAAFDLFKRALAKSPGNSAALQGIALTGFQLGKTDDVDGALSQLRTADPAAADKLAVLGSGTGATSRAASATDKEITSWTDDQ
jgi:tetratricopeptide (TPR) repeat protein